jgi:hypothetical protein
MSTDDRGQGAYYRTIAREFLARKGSGFYLSPRDLDAIAGWEDLGIPLRIVLEGIDRTFERYQQQGRGTRTLSLALCDREVERAMDQHRDRSAGRRAGAPPGAGKRDRARREVERAFRAAAAGDPALSRLLGEALTRLSSEAPDEEALERIEASIEDLLYDRAAPEDKVRSLREAGRDHRGHSAEDIEAASRTRVVKAMRREHRVPYVSLFYY